MAASEDNSGDSFNRIREAQCRRAKALPGEGCSHGIGRSHGCRGPTDACNRLDTTGEQR